MRQLPRAVTVGLILGLTFVPSGTPRLCGQDAEAGQEAEAVDVEALHGMKGQFWVLDFKPVHLRMIASPRRGASRQGDWHRKVHPDKRARAEKAKATGKGPKIKDPATEAGKVYWYLVYTVANRTKEDREVFLSVSAVSDGKKQYADLFLPRVEKAIEKRERQSLWGKSDEFALLSKRDPKDPKYHYLTFKAGEMRKGVAVFNAIDPNASKITVRITGLTNEVVLEVKEDGTKELVERVREYYYQRPGDEYAVNLDSFKLGGKAWVKKRLSLQAAEPSSEE